MSRSLNVRLIFKALMNKQISRFNLGYVLTEDRLLFEAVEESAVKTFWVTRRGAFAWVKLFEQQLGLKNPFTDAMRQAGVDDTKELSMMNAFERDIVASRSPPAPGKLESPVVGEGGVVEVIVGVVKTISLTTLAGLPQRYKIIIGDVEDNRWGFEANREMFLKLHEMLVQQIERAEWLV